MKNNLNTNMLPIGMLMIEHRLIERAVTLLAKEMVNLENKNQVNAYFIDSIVDFFRFYADRSHHGKEEDILFRDLGAKPLSQEYKKMMASLVQDHVTDRELVSKIDNAKLKHLRKDSRAIKDIKECISKIVKLYTGHIQKEDKQFFIPSAKYFTQEEQSRMLCEFREFDRKLIHEKYKNVVEFLEKNISGDVEH